MIAGLAGTVAELGADHAVIDVNGVFYLVHASSRTLSRLASGARAQLLVETQLRAESITLFGFPDAEERHWFRLLTSVQGVGGRLALAILSALAPADLARAIGREDRAMIARAPGVGPRLAARIATELKDKAPEGLGPGAIPAAAGDAGPAREAVAALEALGFRPAEAARAVADAAVEAGGDAGVEALVRLALRKAAR
jgi:Holliday junction DNA helicase RuvA